MKYGGLQGLALALVAALALFSEGSPVAGEYRLKLGVVIEQDRGMGHQVVAMPGPSPRQL